MQPRLFALSAVALGATLLAPIARVDAEVFLCADADGRPLYTNTGDTKGCKRVDTGPIVTVPAPRLPARNTAQVNNNLESPRGSAREGATPANYPRVEADAQRSRDGDRRRILEDELRAEEERVGRLRE